MNGLARASTNRFPESASSFIDLLCCEEEPQAVREMVLESCPSVPHNTPVFKAVERVIRKGQKKGLVMEKGSLLVYEEGDPPGSFSRRLTFVNKKGHPIVGLPQILFNANTMKLIRRTRWPS